MKPTKKPRLSLGFCSAASVLADPSIVTHQQESGGDGEKQINNDEDVQDENVCSNATVHDLDFRILLTCVGWPHHAHLHNDIKPSTGIAVHLEREPTNEHDPHAVLVRLAEDNDKKKIGYIKKEESAMLAALMDRNMIVLFSNVSISTVYRSSFLLRATGYVNSRESLELLDNFRRTVDLDTNTSKKITSRDVEQSSKAPYRLSELQPLPWLPFASAASSKTTVPWSPTHPYDASKVTSCLAMQDINECKSNSWPPSDAILVQLGLAPANDTAWWYDTAGLLPPSHWNVTGALDVASKLSSLSSTHKKCAADTLDGAIHGVTNVWHPDTLEAATKFMEEPNFWCRRSSDALIRAFGGAYVLGQQEDKLVLVRGAPHTTLTDRMCLAHNLVYTAVHLTALASPGFNTIIFGYNQSGAGFHYHQDAVSELKAKNSSLIPRQPVVTTVVYQKSDKDSGKEVVLWKPLLNFSSAGSEIYSAARAVLTTHGMMHVQQAGLQSKALHGVFHAPHDTNHRKGYRVAITARISKLNGDEIVQEFSRKGSYCEEYGPGGDCSCLGSS